MNKCTCNTIMLFSTNRKYSNKLLDDINHEEVNRYECNN